uniref:Peptidase C1A papain C-terminal domain-containing protein n=1 Tax=Mola mola TaxID=94237 RepID=A0A3Q4ALR4_MOLML
MLLYLRLPRQMKGDRTSAVLIATLPALLATLCCQNVTRGDTWTELNGSAVEFWSFRERFHRTYGVNSQQFDQRLRSFQDAIKRHVHLNSLSTSPKSAQYGINQFSDLSQEEFRNLYLQASSDQAPLFPGPKTEGLPAKFDWRDKTVVAPVPNQLACGSCWAFSVVGAMQSVHAIGGSQLMELSVQQVLDLKLVLQPEYPYKAKTGICHFFSPSHGGVALKNFTAHGFSGQEEAMMGHLVEHGPLAVIVDAVSWQDYLGGIIQHHCSSQRSNHAVLVVGYNAAGEIPYWIVQNSWGTTWGDEGYVYIKIGGNVCGIADSVAALFL